MAFKLTPTPAALIEKHGRLHHLHYGVKVLCQVTWINTRGLRGAKSRRWVRLGVWCPYCGFMPDDATREMAVEALGRMFGSSSKQWSQTWGI